MNPVTRWRLPWDRVGPGLYESTSVNYINDRPVSLRTISIQFTLPKPKLTVHGDRKAKALARGKLYGRGGTMLIVDDV